MTRPSGESQPSVIRCRRDHTRRLFVLAGATPISHGRPRITDETLEPFDIHSVQAGDVVGIGIHAGNALRGYETGTLARSEAVKAHGGDGSTANMAAQAAS